MRQKIGNPRVRGETFAGEIKPVALAIGLAFGLGVGAVPVASAATITVNNLAGGSVGGQCTLSDAIVAANTDAAVQGCAAGSGADIINFTVTGTISPPAELAITTDVTISGPGAASLTITPAGTNRSVHISGTPAVTISGVTFSGNGTTVGDGAAIYLKGTVGATTLTIQNCVFTNNSTASGDGGALFLYDGGAVTIQSSTFTGNHAGGRGGAIKFYDIGPVTVTGSTISGNSSGNRGGGMFFYKTTSAAVTDSTISGNTAASNGGGMFFYKVAGATTISGSTISGNTSSNGNGGGLFFYKNVGSTTISDSTISGNTATNGQGGGILLYAQTLTINNSTLTGNSTPNGQGGGVYLSDSSANVLTLNSTIVANSTSSGGSLDLGFIQGVFNATNSLVENPTGITFAVNVANIFSQDPVLGPLANNGGPTLTHALLAGSPAIDAGSNPTALAFDQRGAGFARTSGAQTDIGAFEVQGAPPPPPSGLQPVPTLSQWGLALLSLLTAAGAMITGFGRRRRRR